jgi:hypothetical protein
MTQPTFTDFFGSAATYNSTTNKLEIPLSTLSGLDSTAPTASQALAAIVKSAYAWLAANTDDAVLVDTDLTVIAPSTRNGIQRTQFNYSLQFYAPYSQPTLDPDNI